MGGVLNRIKKIEDHLAEALCADRHVIQRELDGIKRHVSRNKPLKQKIKKLYFLEKKLKASVREKTWRKENRPRVTYNPDLPIIAKKDEIVDAIQNNPVVIISGETGSGKTTQIPKFCLEAGRGIDGKIGCTQPRRIAATTVAHRISEELGEVLGTSVGYKIRFKTRSVRRTFIKIMTDGILLAEAQRDPFLNHYDTIIVDEAHERNLNIDFVLGILKLLLLKRNDLKIIITSATIDTEKFSKAFDDAPVIEVSGRMYPVEVRYLAPETRSEETEGPTHIEMAVRAVDTLQKESPFGDILIFMPTEQGIRETRELIEGRHYKGLKVFPLFARLSAAEQKSVFSRAAGRKVIIATNIAETSITIPGIKYVVDTGLARILQYSPRSRTTALPVVPISKSSADQRMGRCGRVENGICIRLFSEEDYNDRPLFTLPEILRSNLADVILRMVALGLGDISEFSFIDRPQAKSIQDGFKLLQELGAITRPSGKQASKEKQPYTLTPQGKIMASIPIDPRLSRILIEARAEGCLKEVRVIVSALSIPDPRERPVEKSAQADQAHAVFKDPASDFITFFNIWTRYHETFKREKTAGSLKRFCKTHFLSFRKMREWQDIHTQITAILKEHHFESDLPKEKKAPPVSPVKQVKKEPQKTAEDFSARYAAVHRSILSGFLSNIALKKEKNIYKAAGGREVMVFPGSGLFNKAGTWVAAAEMVETSRLFIRTVANIDNAWLESLAKDQCRYTYLHPHWEKNRGEVVASEQVSLYGLIIVSERPVSFGRIDSEAASDIFVQSALVAGDIKQSFPFLRHNQQLIADVRDMENRFRRRDLLVGEQEIFEFYKKRLPAIYDIRTLERHLKQNGGDDFLHIQKEDLLLYSPDSAELSLYPGSLSIGEKKLPYRYRFNPESPEDGVTVQVSEAMASMVPPDVVDWMVPGLLKAKITALLRKLPKKYRTRLVPISKTADIIMDEMPKGGKNLATALSTFIFKRFGQSIPAAVWPLDDLPDHLRMRIEVRDAKGNIIKAGREKTLLYQEMTETPQHNEIESARRKWEKTGITRWDFEDLPESITLAGSDGIKWLFFPGLEEDTGKGNHVRLRLYQRRQEATAAHLKGVAKLYRIYFSKELKYLKRVLKIHPQDKMLADYFGGATLFEKRLYESVTKDLFTRDIRTQNEFTSHAKKRMNTIIPAGQNKLNLVLKIAEAYHACRVTIYRLETETRNNQRAAACFNNLREDLLHLVPETFMDLYGNDRLIHLPRYIKALEIRSQRSVANFDKDQIKARQLVTFVQRLGELLKELTSLSSEEKRKAVEEYFWLLEEYKVSLFAQELKTVVPVSKKRLELKLAEIEKMI